MIRPYQPSDKPHLIKLIRLNTPPYFDASEEALFDNYLDNEIEDYFVVEQNESIIACGGLNYDYDKKEAFLSWGMVHPTYQGWGIGSQLSGHRIKHLNSVQGINTLVVRTSQHTYKFYEKMGFELKSVTNNYWGPNLHLHYMQMKV